MRPGDPVALTCDDLDDEGAGLAAHGGARVHVAAALPGERVFATVTHVSSHRPEAWARLDSIERLSSDRRPPACAAFGSCGGCVLQHLDVAAQLGWKARRLGAALAAHPALAGLSPGEGVPAPRALGYRNRSKLVCAARDGRVVLGAFAPRSHDVVDLTGCRVSEAPLEELAGALRVLLASADVAPYDERTFTGDLRHVVLRANHAGAVLVVFVVARPGVPAVAALARRLRALRPEVAGVIENVNRTRGNVIFGQGRGDDDERVLEGAATLEERVGDVRLRLSPRAFFQANRDVAALAYAALARAVDVRAGEHVVDAYCGVGGIALTLARGAPDAQILGVEESAAAIDDATASAALNGLPRARFVAGDVAVRLRDLPRADVVVLNPPRKGCGAAALAEVARLAPRVVAYLSCDPDTLARDLAALTERGYDVREVTPFDMLPHTPHVEALAILDRRARVEALRS
ncbi:MAG TPA: 23S rRNA (uracil(1939)-C(5))-methyltransferase RlmD [Polyangia bacterium]|nr:23S rRNA (uracil(1939)-C(5))-methyltransferase RlmD [Polyangia bacterium]